jgi:hypothetical protein
MEELIMITNSRLRILSLFLVTALIAGGLFMFSCSSDNNPDKISGFVLSGNQPLEGMIVTLRSSGTQTGISILGVAETDETGFFSISFNAPTNPEAILYMGLYQITTIGYRYSNAKEQIKQRETTAIDGAFCGRYNSAMCGKSDRC